MYKCISIFTGICDVILAIQKEAKRLQFLFGKNYGINENVNTPRTCNRLQRIKYNT